ncbi:SpoVR family protein [Salinarchaeum laminariae]|uniref:SpoVR family protein n=1 Tax=Salinarchaeum laminariae TaxID=869888 RepID=UPI0020C138AE|nr:SpoVR family protein [Salinarchaeum laminariae]
MSKADHYEARRQARELEGPVAAARALAERLGLEPVPVNYWIVDHDEMNELIAYDGFQTRYPHWRWGMKYDRQRKQDRYTGGKAFEIVNNDSPANAFLQESNGLADQKAVITHVEAHADFFANNQWFGLFPGEEGGAAAMLERHATRIAEIADDPEIDREAVESWIDTVLTLDDTIDQQRAFQRQLGEDGEGAEEAIDLSEQLAELDVSDEVRGEVFDDDWLDDQTEDEQIDRDAPEADVLAFLREHGMAYDESAERAVEFEDWQREILELLRAEAYYFAAQRMTKVMNEGWAAYWESIMMAGETFADVDEFLTYADHMAKVLASPGLNPYALGLELWTYVENRTNRREVLERLLAVEGVGWRNLDETVDWDEVRDALEPPEAIAAAGATDLDAVAALPDHLVDRDEIRAARDGAFDPSDASWRLLSTDGMARRHYSLVRPEHRQFLEDVSRDELEEIARYVFDGSRYDSVTEALADVDYAAGWNRMFEIRESHNDVTFLDAFLTAEFVDANDYFTYEYSRAAEEHRVASTDPEDVKRKLLLQFTNLGKPTITVEDGNYGNRNELLLGHQFNGVALDLEQAERVLERTFELWGRPVNLATIVKEVDDHDVEVARRRSREPEPEEAGLLLRYDGSEIERRDLPWSEVEDLAADDVDYDTKPEDWLQ